MDKPLTYRQRQFLKHFVDLFNEHEEPLHYKKVAQEFEISDVSAYEMLRLLEKKNLIKVSYQSTADQIGPGRPSVLFEPSQKAIKTVTYSQSNQEISALNEFRQLIIDRLHRKRNYEVVLSEVLNNLHNKRSSLVYSAQLITAIILTLATVQDSPEMSLMLMRLERTGLPHELGIGVFSGIGLLLPQIRQIHERNRRIILEHIEYFEEALYQLSEENRQKLSKFVREIVLVIND